MSFKDGYAQIKSISEHFNIPLDELKMLVNDKKIPHYRISKRLILFKVSQIEQWIKNGGLEK